MCFDPDPMYHRELTREGRTHRFVIMASRGEGWEVREERDGELLRRQRLLDWHRVEFERASFSMTAASLRNEGWTEVA
jgi:hypothetical protein